MNDSVLDASALLALLRLEPGADVVAKTLPHATISAVNLSEVVAKLADAGMPREEIHNAIQGLQLNVTSFDVEQAYETGLLRPSKRGLGLSLGDRSCLSLALRLDLPALTTDRTWEQSSVGAKVTVIR